MKTMRRDVLLSRLRQVLAALACGLAFTEEGLSDGYTTSALPQLFKSDLAVTVTSAAWIGGLLQLGRTLPPFLLVMVSHIGRRQLLLVASFFRIIGWGLIVGAQCVEMVYAGRFFVGLGSGLFLIIAPIFLSEISSPSIRGRLTLLSISCFNVGIVLSYVLGTILSWQQLGGCGLALAFFNGCSLVPFLETPDILMLQNRKEEARVSIVWYRGTHELNVDLYLDDLAAEIHNKQCRVPTLRDMRERASYYPFLLFLAMDLLFRSSGYNVIAGFTTDFLSVTVSPPLQTAVVMGVANCVVGFAAVVTVDKFGRRHLLLILLSAASASMLILGVCKWIGSGIVDYISIVAIAIFFSCATIGPGAVTYIAMAESCPMIWRAWMCAFIIGSGRLFGFVVVSSYHALTKVSGLYGVCFLYACALTLSTVIAAKWMLETRGKSLEEIHGMMRFGKHKELKEKTVMEG